MSLTGIEASESDASRSQNALMMAKCTCKYCKCKIDPALAVKHLKHCQVRIQKLESKEKQETPEQTRLVCPYCWNRVHAKNIAKHIQRVHFPNELIACKPTPQTKQSKSNKPTKPKVVMISRRGTKTVGLGLCDNCRVVHMEHWTYQFSDGTSKTVCRFCKGLLLDKAANRKTDTLDRCVPGSAMNGKRR